jgi:hypothetical protein
MGNHFHLVVRMHPEDEVSDEEILKRYKEYYGEENYLAKDQIDEVRKRLCSLAAYVKDIKQGFTRASRRRDHRLPSEIMLRMSLREFHRVNKEFVGEAPVKWEDPNEMRRNFMGQEFYRVNL